MTTNLENSKQPMATTNTTTHRLVVTQNINVDSLKSINNQENDMSGLQNNVLNACVVSPLIVQMNNDDEESDNESITNIVKSASPIKNSHRDFKNIFNSNNSVAKVVSIKKTSTIAFQFI